MYDCFVGVFCSFSVGQKYTLKSLHCRDCQSLIEACAFWAKDYMSKKFFSREWTKLYMVFQITVHSITILCALWIIGPLTFLSFIILVVIDNQGNFTLLVGISSYFLEQLLFVKYDSEYYFFIFRNKFSVRLKIFLLSDECLDSF